MVDSSPSHIISKKTFVDYLQDVAGGSHDNHDGGDDDDDETEGAEAEKLRPPESSDENRSHSQRKRKTPMCGMTSPQLTEARSFVNGLLSPFSPLFEHREQRDEYLEFVSLQPCRKLSVVVRVLPCDDSGQRCLFQHVRTNNLTQKPKSPHDMVVVKPSAFGKVIPSQVTMETARLVAQVAHISSEDWARLYEFHHVMWPDQQQEQHTDLFGTMDSLSQAVAQDALMERQSSLLISMGQARTCVDPTSNGTCLLAKIIKCCQTLMEPKAAAIISMVELQEEKDSFRDLFNKENKQVSLRHVDMKGAVLEGLTQIPLDDFNDTWKTLRHKQKFTIVATISIWDNAVAQQLKRSPDSHITCVELAPSTDPNASHSKVTNTSNTVCLGLALRQLSLHSSMETDPAISYRESNITKVLQRALESSKIVLLASVSQLSEDYEITLATLNFLRSLLVKSGKTASSPFHNKDQPQEEDGVKTFLSDQLQQYAKDESLLEQIIADPRQRLAKVFKQSPAESKQQIFIDAVPSEEYNPVDYMQGLDIDHEAWQSPAPPQQERRASTTLDRQRPVVIEETPKEIWSMEEPLDDLPLSNQSLSGSIASPEDFRIISSFQAHTLINEGQFFEMEQQGDDFSLGLGKNDVSQLDLVLDDQSMGNKEQCIEGDNWSVEKGERDILDLEDEENEDFFFAGDKIQQSQNNITEEHHSMSEEIVFSREEPKTRSHKSKESQSYQRTHDFPGSSDFPDRNVQMLPEFAHHDLSLDDSVVSRGEISSYFEEDMPRGKASLRKGREIHEPLAFLSSPRICSDTNSGPCSGIDSVFSSQKSNTLGDVFGHSGERREYSSKAKQKEVEEAPYIDEIQILEDALYQIQSKQRGVWRAR